MTALNPAFEVWSEGQNPPLNPAFEVCTKDGGYYLPTVERPNGRFREVAETSRSVGVPSKIATRRASDQILGAGPADRVFLRLLKTIPYDPQRDPRAPGFHTGGIDWTEDHAWVWAAIVNEAVLQLDADPGNFGSLRTFVALDTIAAELGWPTDGRGLRRVAGLIRDLFLPSFIIRTEDHGAGRLVGIKLVAGVNVPDGPWRMQGQQSLNDQWRERRILQTWADVPTSWLLEGLHALSWPLLREAPDAPARRLLAQLELGGNRRIDAGQLVAIPEHRPPSWARAKLDRKGGAHEWAMSRELLTAKPTWSNFEVRYSPSREHLDLHRPYYLTLPAPIRYSIRKVQLDYGLSGADLAAVRRIAGDGLRDGKSQDAIAYLILLASRGQVDTSLAHRLRDRVMKLDSRSIVSPGQHVALAQAAAEYRQSTIWVPEAEDAA